jgi:hypothetical protein
MGVVLGVDPMEPTEKPFAAAPLRRVLLLRLRPDSGSGKGMQINC